LQKRSRKVRCKVMVKSSKWQELPHPPVVLALFQVKFRQEVVDWDIVKRIEGCIIEQYPVCVVHNQSKFSISSPLQVGCQTVKADTDTKIIGYTFSTKDQKVKLNIEQGTVTYHDERKYAGWDHFKSSISSFLSLISPIISDSIIQCVSIRFINKFVLPDFKNPLDYTNIIISSAVEIEHAYPVSKYSFKLFHEIPETNIKGWVNHSLDNVDGKLNYIFDIDILNHENIVYDQDTIMDMLEKMRDVKNEIFFETLTEKTLSLCY